MEKAKTRLSNLELYRIIVMLLIIAHHYVVNSGVYAVIGETPWTPASLGLLLFGAWGKTGINCFVLITGYFMCKSEISAKKFFKLFLQIMFYRIVFNIIFWVTSYNPFTLKGLLLCLIPIRSINTGFSPAFLIFFLCIPFLNILIRNMTERRHVLLLCLMFFLYVFLGTLPGFSVRMNYVSWFCVLYLISSYIRLYPKKIFDSTKLWGVLTLVCLAASAATVVFFTYTKAHFGFGSFYSFVQDSNTFLAVATGVASFMFFKNIKIPTSKFINTVSSTCFGVLLIHANSDSMRQWLWNDTLKNARMYSSPYLALHAVLSVIAIFSVCCVIDLVRIKFIEKPFFKLWDRHYGEFSEKFNRGIDKIFTKLNIGSE